MEKAEEERGLGMVLGNALPAGSDKRPAGPSERDEVYEIFWFEPQAPWRVVLHPDRLLIWRGEVLRVLTHHFGCHLFNRIGNACSSDIEEVAGNDNGLFSFCPKDSEAALAPRPRRRREVENGIEGFLHCQILQAWLPERECPG